MGRGNISIQEMEEINELNEINQHIKEIKVKKEFEKTKVELQPNRTAIGKDFKQDSPKILQKITPEILEKLKSGDHAFVNNFELTEDHIIIKESLPEEFISSEFKEGLVIIDPKQTEELELEGFAREVIRRVQDIRKELELKREQEIELAIEGDIDVSKHAKIIQEKVGAKTISFEKKGYQHITEFKVRDKFFKAHLNILTT